MQQITIFDLFDESTQIISRISRQSLPRKLEEKITEEWKKHKAKNQFSEPIAGFKRYKRKEEKIELTLIETDYKTHFVVNMKRLIHNADKISQKYGLDVISAGGYTITKDGKLVIGTKRKKQVLVPGGFTKPFEKTEPDIIISTEKREFQEEITEEEIIESIKHVGVVYSELQDKGYTFISIVKLSVDSKSLRKMFRYRKDNEIEDITFLSNTPEDLTRFLHERKEALTNHAFGGLLVAGNRIFGKQWYEKNLIIYGDCVKTKS